MVSQREEAVITEAKLSEHGLAITREEHKSASQRIATLKATVTQLTEPDNKMEYKQQGPAQ